MKQLAQKFARTPLKFNRPGKRKKEASSPWMAIEPQPTNVATPPQASKPPKFGPKKLKHPKVPGRKKIG